MSRAEDIRLLMTQVGEHVGARLADPPLFEQALTHRSYANEQNSDAIGDNERLEFLGDAVLSLAVSEILMTQHPAEPEGTLSKFRSAIVNEKSLALAARSMRLGAFLRLGKGEEMTGGREKESLLANAFEALVAAVYLDAGLKAAAKFVSYYLSDLIQNADVESTKSDFKTALQEMTQRKLRTTPIYRLVEQDGPDHDKMFESQVEIDGRTYGRGRARSKKDSEQGAAEEGLKNLINELGEPTDPDVR